MKKQFKGLGIALFLILIISTIAFIFIQINRPYYMGFEKRLNYLSPNISENAIEFSQQVYIDKPSEIKIIFEIKDLSVPYSRDKFNEFINDLTIQVWDQDEYISFNKNNIEYIISDNRYQVYLVGEIKGGSTYNLYVKSNLGENPRYNIGIGIGLGANTTPLGNNIRRYY